MLLVEFAIFLTAAVIAVPLFKRIGLGTVLGYLAAGAVIGPHGLNLVHEVDEKMHFAELGVVLLLFLIGLELAPARLWKMRGAVFGLGAAQVVGTSVVLAAAARAMGVATAPAIVVGLALSLSSTAFVLQFLGERKELASPHGRSAFGILLFQDLAAIPMLAIVPALSGVSAVGTGNPWSQAALIAAVFVGLILAGRYLVRPLFRIVASARSQELSTGFALLVVIGTAMLMDAVGLTMAVGAFLAGVLLAESEYRHELEADIEPFKGILLGMFFAAVGMTVDVAVVIERPLLIVGLVLGLVAVKLLVIQAIGRLTGHTGNTAPRLAIALAQGGEFAFVIFGVAEENRMIPARLESLLVVVVSLSMVLTPLLFAAHDRWCAARARDQPDRPYDEIRGEENHVIIAGFGRFGQIIARLLRANRIPFTALEANMTQVDFVRRFGNIVHYGDASRIDLLRAAKVDRAKLFVLAIDDMEASLRTARTVLHHFPGTKIIARARNRQHVYALMDLGIKHIVRETLFSSLHASTRALEELGLTVADAREAVRKFHEYDEQQLVAQYAVRDDQQAVIATAKKAAEDLEKIFEQDARSRI